MIKPNGLTKTISVVTSATTILWLSGLALLAPMAAGAVTINEGDIIRGPDGVKVYIVNANGYKRHIFNPAIFAMYGHLKWSNIKDVDAATLASYTTSDLYKADGDYKVYSLEEISEASGTAIKHHLSMTAAEFELKGYKWGQLFTVNTKERDYYSTGSDLTYTATPVATGALAVALDSATPAAGSVAGGAQDVIFAKIQFTAGAAATVSSIAITRGGIAADSDLSSIKLYDGTTKLGSTQALNSTTHKATFSGLNWALAAGAVKTLTIKGSMATAPGAGNQIKLGIAASTDITLAAGSISGAFPVYGNGMNPTTQSVGRLDVEVQATPAAATVLSGSTEQAIAAFKFSATSTEGFYVHSIKLTETGSSVDADVSNIVLKVSGTQIGATATALVGGGATFDLSAAPLYVQAGGNKIVYAYSNIAAGVTTTRQVQLEVSVADDVVAYGANSGGMVTVTGAAGATFTKQTGALMTIGQGSLTISTYTALDPATQDYVKGTNGRLWTAWDFASGSREGVRVVKLTLTANGCDDYDLDNNCTDTTSGSTDNTRDTNDDEDALTAAQLATDVSNIGLYKYDPTTATYTLITTSSLVGGSVVFGANTSNAFDSPGIFDVVAAGHTYIAVKGDIPTGAVKFDGIRMGIAANTDVWIDGLASQNDIVQTSITVNGTSVYSARHRISNSGTLTSAKGTPMAGTILVQGTTGNTLGWFNLTADSGEDMLVSAIEFDLSEGANTSDGTESGDVTNVKLWDGTTQLGSTIAAPVATTTFSVNLTVPAGTTKTLKVTGDLPTTGTVASSTLRATMDVSETVATGSASGATISDSNTTDITQDNLTVATGSLGASVKTPPISQNIIRGSTSPITFANFLFTAGVAEDVRVTSIKLTVEGDTDGTDGDADDDTVLTAAQAQADIDQVYLYEGATMIAGPKTIDANLNVTFTGLAINLAKGGQKEIAVKAVVKSTATADHGIAFGIAATTDVTGTGLSTNGTVNLDNVTNTNTNALIAMNVKTSGSLYVAATTGALTSTNVIAGASGGSFASFDIGAKVSASGADSSEDIVVSALRVTANTTTTLDAANDNIKTVYVYKGTTLLGQASWDNAVGYVNVLFSTNLTIAKGTKEVVVIKADLNTTAEGADSGDTPRLGIEYNIQSGSVWTSSYASKFNVVAKGALSVQNVYAVDSAGSNPTANLRGNAMTVRKTLPTISYVSSGTNLQTIPGLGEVLRFSVAADAAGDVTLDAISFKMTSTDVATANQWNEYNDATYGGSLILTDFTLYDAADLTTALESADTNWWLMNSTGQPYESSGTQTGTADADIVYYARVDLATDVVVQKGTTKTFVLHVDTTGAKKQTGVSDAVRFDVVGDIGGSFAATTGTGSTSLTNWKFFKWDDGTAVSGSINGQYIKNMPAQGATVQY